jgi:MYXO-CTERM domain-containing protein
VFQILETMRAAKLSVRGTLSYEHFSEGSFPLAIAFKAWLQPIYTAGDATLYVPPLATGLAIVAALLSLRRSRRNPLVCFWLIAEL